MQASFQLSARQHRVKARNSHEKQKLEQTLVRRAKRKVLHSNLRSGFERAFEAIFIHQSLERIIPTRERFLEGKLSKLDTQGHWRERR